MHVGHAWRDKAHRQPTPPPSDLAASGRRGQGLDVASSLSRLNSVLLRLNCATPLAVAPSDSGLGGDPPSTAPNTDLREGRGILVSLLARARLIGGENPMTEQAERRPPTQVMKTVPMTPELSAELYRLCGQLALAKQRSAAWLKHGLSGALSPAGFFARWLRYDETEVALTERLAAKLPAGATGSEEAGPGRHRRLERCQRDLSLSGQTSVRLVWRAGRSAAPRAARSQAPAR